jgi:LmbE family N-acetylglucosaminyl deacetylase
MIPTPGTGLFCPRIILGVAAHPDDIEAAIGGSLATWIKAGAEAYFLILTKADKGTTDRSIACEVLCRKRRSEQRAAAQTLGVRDVFFAEYEDGSLEATPAVKRDIVRHIRKLRPDTVFTYDPGMLYCVQQQLVNHPDHRAAGQATLDAVYPLARDHLAFPELLADEQLEPHKVGTLLLFNLNQSNFYVDISDTLETKLSVLCMHASQFPDSEKVKKRLRQLAKEKGADCGTQYAEAFVRIAID